MPPPKKNSHPLRFSKDFRTPPRPPPKNPLTSFFYTEYYQWKWIRKIIRKIFKIISVPPSPSPPPRILSHPTPHTKWKPPYITIFYLFYSLPAGRLSLNDSLCVKLNCLHLNEIHYFTFGFLFCQFFSFHIVTCQDCLYF